MFQEFPYTNFHELNLDWIVKIAKDFLDQYTHIQEVIQTGLDDLAESRETGLDDLAESRETGLDDLAASRADGLEELNQKTLDGLADLQEKYDTLNGLLQSWYDTHSADIAGQLAAAITSFNTAADAKSQALLDSWPADYSELVTSYNDLKSALTALEDSFEKKMIDILPFYPDDDSGTLWLKGYINSSGSYTTADGVKHRMTSFFLPATVTSIYAESPYVLNIYIYNADGTYDHRSMGISSIVYFDHKNYKYKFGVCQSPAVSLDGVDWQQSITVNAIPMYWNDIDANTESIKTIVEYGVGSIAVENGDFERGSINNNGNNIPVNYAYRSITYLSNTIGSIRAKTGYAFGLYVYDSTNTYISRTLDLTEAKLNHDGFKYKIIMYHYPLDTSSTVSDTIPDEYIKLFTKEINVNPGKSYYSVNNGEITIKIEKAQFVLKRVTDADINIDTWRLYSGHLLNDDVKIGVLWTNSDAEGAIKITGEDDFVCGYHGDEIMTSIIILADGNVINPSTDVYGKKFENITICVESNVYHCNTSDLANQIAFKRTKTLTFTKDGYVVSNRYIAQSALSIERGALAMVMAQKNNLESSPMINYIGCNSDIKLYECPGDSASDPIPHSQTNRPMTVASLYMTNAVLTMSMIYGQNNPGYVPYFNNDRSNTRIKIYFDQYNNQSVAQDEVLQDEFSVTFD